MSIAVDALILPPLAGALPGRETDVVQLAAIAYLQREIEDED